jgi:hypothetical protein
LAAQLTVAFDAAARALLRLEEADGAGLARASIVKVSVIRGLPATSEYRTMALAIMLHPFAARFIESKSDRAKTIEGYLRFSGLPLS